MNRALDTRMSRLPGGALARGIVPRPRAVRSLGGNH